ncbi:MAG: hypothetical protein GX675_02800 [Erysipelotrichaceae bacterium]|nr:hypothetical protein [Erysipelotrichaceae bacterium]
MLWDNGESELAYTLLNQKNPPSWLYEIENGATTIWENWLAIKPDGERTNSSYNHFAFGCVGDFLYRKIGGLVLDSPGYKQIRIEPDFSCGLLYSKLSYESCYGKIKIEWFKQDENIY